MSTTVGPAADTAAPASEADLEERLSRPSPAAVEGVRQAGGDLLVLGAGGKMGLSVARMARRGLDAAGLHGRRVVAVSRFGREAAARPFREAGVETVAADLLADGALEAEHRDAWLA